jgi:hypothetical protein
MSFVDFVRGFFRRKPPISSVSDLADFIDAQSAFLIQKGMYEYVRARSGPYSKIMMKEPEFIEAANRSRWQGYPLGLAMVGEMVEGVLAQAGGDRRGLLDPLIGLVLSVFDRYPLPPLLTAEEWSKAREELALHLERLSTHPPKRVIDIPVPFVDRVFSLMPIHKDLLTDDAPTSRGFLQLDLVQMQEELIRRMDVTAMAARLRELDRS